jgi:hypothetical protein
MAAEVAPRQLGNGDTFIQSETAIPSATSGYWVCPSRIEWHLVAHRRGALLIKTTSPCRACRGSAESIRASAVTAADDPVRRRTDFVDRRLPSRSVAACRISSSTPAAKPSGRNRPSVVAAASRKARQRAAASAGRLCASAATPMTGAMRASESSSSTYQAALPSHPAVEAKTPSGPAPANSPCRDSLPPARPRSSAARHLARDCCSDPPRPCRSHSVAI